MGKISLSDGDAVCDLRASASWRTVVAATQLVEISISPRAGSYEEIADRYGNFQQDEDDWRHFLAERATKITPYKNKSRKTLPAFLMQATKQYTPFRTSHDLRPR